MCVCPFAGIPPRDRQTLWRLFILHYYQHHIGDFIRDTSRLTDSQAMAYLRLMWLYYESENSLPDDLESLAFKIGSESNTVAMLLKCYFYADALRWHHKRIDSELTTYKNKSIKASESAKSRWNNAKAMRTHNESTATAMLTKNQEPITNNQEYKKKGIAKPSAIACPPDVDQSVWNDWLTLRKAKKAPVTETVVNQARAESGKARLTLEGFLKIWCARGSQGLEASWLKPDERKKYGGAQTPDAIFEANMEAARRAKIRMFGEENEI